MKKINVVAAIIRDGNKIFATQRGYGEFKDWWEFPGGKVEENETLEIALKREIREELAVEIEVGELLDVVEYDYSTFHLIMHCFWAKLLNKNIELREHEEAKWLTKELIDSVEWLPADILIVEKIKEELD